MCFMFNIQNSYKVKVHKATLNIMFHLRELKYQWYSLVDFRNWHLPTTADPIMSESETVQLKVEETNLLY